MNTAAPPARHATFREFYPFYLSGHRGQACQRLHFVGSSPGPRLLAALILTGNPSWLLVGLLCNCGVARIGPFGFEKNKPFRRPLFSFMGDWVMYKDIQTASILIGDRR